jgi:hypothetical protein
MNAYGEWMYRSTFFLTSTLLGGEWSASRSDRSTPRERASRTYWIGGWVDPRAGLDDVEKRTFLNLTGLKFRPLGQTQGSVVESSVATLERSSSLQ